MTPGTGDPGRREGGKAGRILSLPAHLSGLSAADLRADLRAGITVGVMLIPQGMAYAMIAGVPPIYGLYAGLVPLFVYPFLGTSRHLSVGPLAVDMLIVAAGVGILASGEPERYLALTFVLASMVGILQILMGMARLGLLVGLLARPVILGFVWAAAIIIAFSQLGHLTGIELPRSQYVLVMLRDALQGLDGIHWPTLGIGVGAMLLLKVGRPIERFLPGPLLVVVAGTLLVWILDLEALGVAVLGAVPSGLPSPSLPTARAEDLRDLVPTALTLAMVQFMTVASLGRTYASRHQYRVDPNRELVAIGSANLIGSIFRSLPVSGSFSRTAVAEQAGVRSSLANVVAAALVGLTLLFLTPVFYYLPMAALAGIIVVAVLGLMIPSEARYLFRTKPRDGYLATFTFVVTLILGIREGLLLGVAASALAILYRMSRPHMVELAHLPGTRFFRDVSRTPRAERIESLLLIRLDAGASFLNAEFLRRFILETEHDQPRPIRAVILDGITMNDLDTTAVDALEEVADDLRKRGTELHLTGLIGPVRDVVQRSGLYEHLGRDHFHRSPHEAVKFILQRWDENEGSQRLDAYRNRVVRREPDPGDEELFGVRPG
jgi:sulfate permease, SulP family